VGGFYSYKLPNFLMPDYKKHDIRNKDSVLQNTYAFNYELKISSSQQIKYLSVPEEVTLKTNPEETQTIIMGNKTATRL
jgi:hypothetical protein